MRLLKGDRGDREGKYYVMLEIESVERRNRLFPGSRPGGPADVGRVYAVDKSGGSGHGEVG